MKIKDFYKIDIQHVARYTNWSKNKIEEFLVSKIYPNQQDWLKFTTIASLILGVGLFCIGLIFFFAYNWNDIPGNIKLSIIFSLVAIFSLFSLYTKISNIGKQLLLTAAATMVGVLFAVFGQIYQTGANAYDFFLAWAVFSLLWVVVAQFLPLWILFFLLVNTTLYFYFSQIKPNTDLSFQILAFLAINIVPVIFDNLWLKIKGQKINKVFSFLFATITVGLGSFYISYIIIDAEFKTIQLFTTTVIVLVMLFIAFVGQFYRQTFYIAILSISILIICISAIIKIIDDFEGFFLISIFVITYITCFIYFITKLQKKWKNESTI